MSLRNHFFYRMDCLFLPLTYKPSKQAYGITSVLVHNDIGELLSLYSLTRFILLILLVLVSKPAALSDMGRSFLTTAGPSFAYLCPRSDLDTVVCRLHMMSKGAMWYPLSDQHDAHSSIVVYELYIERALQPCCNPFIDIVTISHIP